MTQPSLPAHPDVFGAPPSLRSVPSANSLTQRSWSRSRSKTMLNNGSNHPSDDGRLKPELRQAYPQASTSSSTSSPTVNVRLVPRAHGIGLEEGVETGSSHIHHEEDNTLIVAEQSRVDTESMGSGLPKSKLKATAALSRIDTTARPPPSAFSRPENMRSNVRDSMNSVGTRFSTTSSSLYPPSTSTSTASGTESPPSPRSLAEQIENHAISSYDPEADEANAFDGDDVSYRLRLLVKNSYFLPPAHAKPTPSDFAQTVRKKAPRANTPAFLDLFRVGKSKSKPPSPDATPALDSRTPVLRTTGESVTLATRHHPRTNPVPLHQSPLTAHKPPDLAARVVVVREKMTDLATAAKQAEQEMKARVVRKEEEPKQVKVDDVIDPTDAVDLPPPSSKYPFAVQASALHGLGVQDSVGAAILADRLPPPMSLGDSSIDAEDKNWRKALLHAAVGHSLDNTPDISTLSVSPEGPSRVNSPWMTSPPRSPIRTQSPSMKRALGQRIVNQPLIEVQDETEHAIPDHSTPRGPSKRGHPSPLDLSARRSSYFPMRAETPAGPQTPLAPPPRRNIINPLYSLSQTDIAGSDSAPKDRGSSHDGAHTVDVRSTLSSPELSEAYDSTRLMVMTPPPATHPHLSMYSGSSIFAARPSTGTTPQDPTSSTSSIMNAETAESHYSDDDRDMEEGNRPSTMLSLVTDGRPSMSMSEYSQPSPTVSAFQDALTGDDYHSTVSSLNRPWRGSDDLHSASTPSDSPAPRYSTMSPPPRVSSSLATHPLSPPPRSLYQAVHTVRTPAIRPPSSFLDLGEPSPASTSEQVMSVTPPRPPEILAPEPVTPPYPIVERRGHPPSTPLTLSVPSEPTPLSIHSAPPPSSPTSFFDSIQAQPNAMDDLESSSDEDSEQDEDEDEDDEDDGHRPSNLYVDSRTRTISMMTARPPGRPNLMRLGNHSTPHVTGMRSPLPIGAVDPKRPIANVPPPAPLPLSSHTKSKSRLPASTFDFYQYNTSRAAEDPGPSSARRPATADRTLKSWQANQVESSKRLEGMLKQHMEAEKDVIRRIASTHQPSNPSKP
ncbi:hypothetical protein BDN71DRAFT_1445713 [Pleurotus eryngii]|uniref:Uncharacterized protein n=1 Tax=Pleurotus eryngii TaxID=5323 RepID=A0A9P6A3Z1_PLEER|nr:hypothetical protein BDN71DRAFT_1445713 [Pleurotus eryngii]